MKDAAALLERPAVPTPSEVLQDWAKEHAITPVRFMKITGYTYAHAYKLMTGAVPPTTETLGRLVRCGHASLAERIAKVMANRAT